MIKLKTFHKMQKWDSLKKKFCVCFDFGDVEINPAKLLRKKEISKKEAEKRKEYSLIYYDSGNNPIRIDTIAGWLNKESYIFFDGKVIKDAYEFIDLNRKKRLSLYHEWHYIYDKLNRIRELKIITQPWNYIYLHPKMERELFYQYDKKGNLSKIFQHLGGLSFKKQYWDKNRRII